MLTLKKKRGITILLSVFTTLGIFSVGFAMWNMTGGDITIVEGIMEADNYEAVPNYIECVENIRFDGFGFYKERGFAVDGTYSNSTTFTGKFDINISKLKTCVDSVIDGSKSFSLKIEFTASITTGFTYGNPTISGFTNTPTALDTVTSATAANAYNIVLTNAEIGALKKSDLVFGVSVDYGGTSFPDLSNATYTITITPGEYVS